MLGHKNTAYNAESNANYLSSFAGDIAAFVKILTASAILSLGVLVHIKYEEPEINVDGRIIQLNHLKTSLNTNAVP